MEIGSCEQYVLAELDDLRAENEMLRERLAAAVGALADVAVAVRGFREAQEGDDE